MAVLIKVTSNKKIKFDPININLSIEIKTPSDLHDLLNEINNCNSSIIDDDGNECNVLTNLIIEIEKQLK